MVKLLSVPLFAASAISLVFFVAFMVLCLDTKKKLYYRLFSLLSLVNALFLTSFGIMLNADNNLDILDLSARFTIIGAMFTAVISIHFEKKFFFSPNIRWHQDISLKLLYSINVGFCLLCLVPTDLFLQKTFYMADRYYTGLNHGPLFNAWAVYMLGILIYALYLTYCGWQVHRRANDAQPNTIFFLLLAYLVWVLGGIVDVATGQHIIDFPPISWIGSILVVIAVEFIVVFKIAKLNVRLQTAICEHRQTEEALRESEKRYLLSAKGANDGLWDWDLRTNKVYFSTRWKVMLGFDEQDIGDTPEEWFNLIHSDDLESVHTTINGHLAGNSNHFEAEFRMRHKDSHHRWVLCRGLAVADDQGKRYRMAGSITDITTRKLHEEQLLHNALHDHLTGLPNRYLFVNRLQHTLQRMARLNSGFFAVILFDIDRFNVINDNFGHLIGDSLIIALGKRLQACLQDDDTLSRFGGDEYTLLLEGLTSEAACLELVNKILHDVQEPFQIHDHQIRIIASMGIVFGPDKYKDAEQLLRDADIAMSCAQQTSSISYQVFDRATHSQTRVRLALENDLHAVFDSKQLRIYYQPIVALHDGRLSGFEALVQWHHPQRGKVPPSEFIPIMEETGLIIALDRWMLRQACHQLQAWQNQFPSDLPYTISVNFSANQFARHDLVAELISLLKEDSLDQQLLSRIRLEITETALMENPEATTRLLRQLKTYNVQLSLDDFGTGYSSLSYLHQFPADILKIDQSFVKRMCLDKSSDEIVQIMISLAHNLHMKVIAEGIEHKDHLRCLKNWGAEYGQGYYFSKSVEATEATRLLQEQPWMHDPLFSVIAK